MDSGKEGRRVAGSNTEVVVFLASPSDLGQERDVLRETIERVNADLAGMGVYFRVTGWENTLPRLGRAQGLINPDVERAQVFIGMLKGRWGTATGTHDSGFAEEFELAQSLFDTNGEPDVHLFFGDLPQDRLDDPGDELKKVLEFKTRIETERIALYGTFGTPAELASQVQRILFNKALELTREAAGRPETGTSGREDSAPLEVESGEIDEAREQMSGAYDRVAAWFKGGDVSDGAPDFDRVELVANAFGRDKHLLGAHLVNRLFRRREELILSNGEAALWLRTLLADFGNQEPGERTIPGWAVFSDVEEERIGEEFAEAAQSSETAVARGAVRAFDELGIRPTELFGTETARAADRQKAWVGVLNANPGVSVALDMFLRTFAFGPFFVAVAESADLNADSAGLIAAAEAANSGSPGSLAAEYAVASASTRNRELRRLVLEHLPQVPDSALEKLARRVSGTDLRRPVLHAALERDLLDAKDLDRIVAWDDETEIEWLIQLAKGNPRVAELVASVDSKLKIGPLQAALRAAKQSAEELRAEHLAQPWDDEIWEARLLAAQPEDLAEARNVIDTDAVQLRSTLKPYITGDELLDFVVAQHLMIAGQAVLKNLSSAPSSEARRADLQRVVRAVNLERRINQARALGVLAYTVDAANSEEVELVRPLLQDVINNGWPLPWVALLATPLGPALATLAMASDNDATRTVGRTWHASQDGTADAELTELLYDDNSRVRMAAVENVLRRSSREQLKDLLNRYPDDSRVHWYNIIVALDEHLHASQLANQNDQSAGVE